MTERALTVPTASAITRLEDVAEIRGTWVESKRQELALAESALKALRATEGVNPNGWRVRNVQNRVKLLRGVVRALERGFIPIPRFDSLKLQIETEELPVSALVAFQVAQAEKIFDEIRFVRGRAPEGRRGPYGRSPARDPLLVGVVRVPDLEIRDARGWHVQTIRGREEHFLVAWWRPEDERDEVMF